MKMNFCTTCFLIVMSGTIANNVSGAEPGAALKSQFERTLQNQSEGSPVDRKSSARASDQESPFVRWLSGDLEREGKWSSFLELGASTDEALQQYRAKRTELQGQRHFHGAMAKWCELNKLPELAKAHYYGVLSANPNDAEARAAIGDRWVAGRWFTAEEVESARLQAKQLVEGLEEWLPRVGQIARGLLSTNPKVKSVAVGELEKIDRSQAVPALEILAQRLDGDNRKKIIQVIAKIRSRDACLALTRLALLYIESEAGQVAVRELKTYPAEMYVPELLQLLSSTSFDSQWITNRNGQVALITLISQEMKDAKYIQRLEKSARVMVSTVSSSASIGTRNRVVEHAQESSFASNDYAVPLTYLGEIVYKHGGAMTERLGESQVSAHYFPRLFANASALNLLEDREVSQTIAAEHARKQQAWNHRVCEVLRSTTDATLDDTPATWWSWWIDENERYVTGKPTYTGYRQEYRTISLSATYNQDKTGSFDIVNELPYRHMQWSCLVKGTMIQTSDGLRPIESIQVGDLVMSQDVESGKLALKPVILTTVRPPKSTLRITIGDEEIQATGGHLWWVSGRGWVKTRDLRPGMQLHNATGTTEIAGVTEDARQMETYNLVVEGYHTYFVGQDRILSYDNTLVRPTLRTVPGFGLLASANSRAK